MYNFVNAKKKKKGVEIKKKKKYVTIIVTTRFLLLTAFSGDIFKYLHLNFFNTLGARTSCSIKVFF